MKKLFTLLMALVMCASMVACSNDAYMGDDDDYEADDYEADDTDGDSHKHDWSEATCSEPQTCKDCGATHGEPNGHNYEGNVCVDCGDKLPGKGLAYELFEENGETYAAVTGMGDCTDTEIVIESTYVGAPVVRINEYAFSGTNITEVVIPDSVTTIGKGAFHSCKVLKTVKLGKSVESIGAETFNYCNALTSIIMPKSIIETGIYLFFNCNALTDIYCEREEPTYGWNRNWNGSDATAHWGLDIGWEYVDGVPTLK